MILYSYELSTYHTSRAVVVGGHWQVAQRFEQGDKLTNSNK